MVHASFLTEFLLILIVATVVAVVFDRFRIPTILGFLLAGVLVGPSGLALIVDSDRIHLLAELGVILLMLTIGLEFSMERLRGLRKIAIFGGSLQILISIGVSMLFAWWKDWTFYQGFFLGSVIALSSTAIVFKFLIDRGEIDTQYGRAAVAILLFQDFAVVPLLIFITGVGESTTEIVQIHHRNRTKLEFRLSEIFLIARRRHCIRSLCVASILKASCLKPQS